MTSAYPQRRGELDAYQNDVIDMASRFPGCSFYEYHKAFSARAAAMLANYNIKIDWSVRDTVLFCSVFAGHHANACSVCNSLSHATISCPQTASSDKTFVRGTKEQSKYRADSYGKAVMPHDRLGTPKAHWFDKEICNN